MSMGSEVSRLQEAVNSIQEESEGEAEDSGVEGEAEDTGVGTPNTSTGNLLGECRLQWQTCTRAKILIKTHFLEPLPLAWCRPLYT